MSKLIVRVLIALLCLKLIQARSRRTQLVIYNITCNIITERMKRFDCFFRKKAEGQFIINQYWMFSQNLGKEFQVRVWLQIYPSNSNRPVNFIDVTLNVCESLKSPIESPLTILINDMKRSSNMRLSCPIKGNFLYKMLNYSVNDAYFPSYAPFLNFSYNCELYDEKMIFAASQVMGAIVPG